MKFNQFIINESLKDIVVGLTALIGSYLPAISQTTSTQSNKQNNKIEIVNKDTLTHINNNVNDSLKIFASNKFDKWLNSYKYLDRQLDKNIFLNYNSSMSINDILKELNNPNSKLNKNLDIVEQLSNKINNDIDSLKIRDGIDKGYLSPIIYAKILNEYNNKCFDIINLYNKVIISWSANAPNQQSKTKELFKQIGLKTENYRQILNFDSDRLYVENEYLYSYFINKLIKPNEDLNNMNKMSNEKYKYLNNQLNKKITLFVNKVILNKIQSNHKLSIHF